MGNPKQKWTSEEEEALIAGVAKHGAGRWKNIQRDPEFNPFLSTRSNIDLKDKWRNMTVTSGGQVVREKSRTPKLKANFDADAPTPSSNMQTSAPIGNNVVVDLIVDDALKSVVDDKTAPKYNALIFEAISTLNEPNGVDIGAIVNYIERRQELPPNFRRLLSSKLRRLVAQEKLEKVQNCFKIKDATAFGTKTPAPNQKDIWHRHLQSTGFTNAGDTIEDAAAAAAYRVAEAENKSFVAAEAVREAERISKMAEYTDSQLQLAEEIFEKCSQGMIVRVPGLNGARR